MPAHTPEYSGFSPYFGVDISSPAMTLFEKVPLSCIDCCKQVLVEMLHLGDQGGLRSH